MKLTASPDGTFINPTTNESVMAGSREEAEAELRKRAAKARAAA